MKLGYGGTKEEMERLLEDASKLSGIEYDISSFADVAEAIHVIQENMDIAGTSMNEAMDTVEGSINMTKAAWQNFMVGLGDSNADLTGLLNNLITSAGAAVSNIVPVVGNLGSSIVELLTQNAPQILQSGIDFVTNFVTGINAGIPNLYSQAQIMLINLLTTIQQNFPSFLQTGFDILTQIGNGIISNVPYILQVGSSMIKNILNTITALLPQFLQKGTEFVNNMVNGVVAQIPSVISTFSSLLNQAVSFIMQNLPQFLQKGAEIIVNLVNGLVQNAPAIISAIANTIFSLISTIGSNLPQFLQKGIEIIFQLAAGLIRAIPQAIAAVPQIVSGIWNAFTSVNWLDIGVNIIRGIGNGIVNGVTGLVSAAKEAARKVVNGVKSFFGIHSPSTKMRDEVGRYIPAGVAEGIEENSDMVTDAMNDIGDMVATPVKAPKIQTGTSGGFTYGGAITINVYASEGQDAKEIAEEVSEILAKQTQRKKAVYGN